MKNRADLVAGWIKKAQSDLLALEGSLQTGAYDAACFHAQQAAEKYLKALLTYQEVEFPFTHNLVKLVELCAGFDSSFRALLPEVEPLTPYAVELRYDAEFWPEKEVAEAALVSAKKVKDFVLKRLPPEVSRQES